MADENKGILARLLTETWPAKAAGGILDALMLPGQVAGGILGVKPERPGYWSDTDEARSQLTNQTMMQRAADLGGLMMLGGYGQAPAGAIGMSGAQRLAPEARLAFDDPVFKELALRDAQRYAGQGGNKVYMSEGALDKARGYSHDAGSPMGQINEILAKAKSDRSNSMQRFQDDMHSVRNRGETADDAAEVLWNAFTGRPIYPFPK